MEQARIPAGTTIQMGKSAKPMAEAVLWEMSAGLGRIEEIAEAHLPLCYAPGAMQKPAFVLILGVKPNANLDITRLAVAELLRHVLPQGAQMDFWPLPEEHQLLKVARTAGCELRIERQEED